MYEQHSARLVIRSKVCGSAFQLLSWIRRQGNLMKTWFYRLPAQSHEESPRDDSTSFAAHTRRRQRKLNTVTSDVLGASLARGSPQRTTRPHPPKRGSQH